MGANVLQNLHKNTVVLSVSGGSWWTNVETHWLHVARLKDFPFSHRQMSKRNTGKSA